MFKQTIASFIAAAMPDGIKQNLALRKQADGEKFTVADITLEHMSLLDSQRLRILRDFVLAHIALRFPILSVWDVAFPGYTDLVSI